jgi:hypothetical protein
MKAVVTTERIERLILLIRGHKVILDTDLAVLYGVTTKRLNEQVRRNRSRFPTDFMFQLSSEEVESLRSQVATSKQALLSRKEQPSTEENSGDRRREIRSKGREVRYSRKHQGHAAELLKVLEKIVRASSDLGQVHFDVSGIPETWKYHDEEKRVKSPLSQANSCRDNSFQDCTLLDSIPSRVD